MKQNETTTKHEPIVANSRLQQMMALANEIGAVRAGSILTVTTVATRIREYKSR